MADIRNLAKYVDVQLRGGVDEDGSAVYTFHLYGGGTRTYNTNHTGTFLKGSSQPLEWWEEDELLSPLIPLVSKFNTEEPGVTITFKVDLMSMTIVR